MAPELTEQLRPAAEEAIRRGISRERLVRQIAKRQTPGVVIGGRYFVVVQPAGAGASGRVSA